MSNHVTSKEVPMARQSMQACCPNNLAFSTSQNTNASHPDLAVYHTAHHTSQFIDARHIPHRNTALMMCCA